MKKIILLLTVATLVITSCTVTKPVAKSEAYKGIYSEKPITVLVMPPINKSTNVDAKEYFHSTLNVPLANKGFYVIPPFLSMEILKKESAYDAELFASAPLQKFGEIFGADVALFTTIYRWDKSSIGAKVTIEVEYVLKSTKTNEVLYTRRGTVVYDSSVSVQGGGIGGLLVGLAASAINTAAVKYVDVARSCNAYTFSDLPQGKYSPKFELDAAELAGSKTFKVLLNSKSPY